MAKYKKKRVRELQHDRFRDTAMNFFDRVAEQLEGKGRAIVYGIIGVVLAVAIVGFWIKWNHRKSDEARRALGRAIAISTASISLTPPVNTTALSFTSEQERAQNAIDEFQKVAAKYGDPYRSEARYFAATNLLYVDRNRGISELSELSKSNLNDIAVLASFALAQAKETDGRYDEAAQLYGELARQNSAIITPETANLRLAMVYEKQSKKKEAADLLFNLIDSARKARDVDGSPLPPSAAATEAAKELQKLDSDRYAQLPPEAPVGNISF